MCKQSIALILTALIAILCYGCGNSEDIQTEINNAHRSGLSNGIVYGIILGVGIGSVVTFLLIQLKIEEKITKGTKLKEEEIKRREDLNNSLGQNLHRREEEIAKSRNKWVSERTKLELECNEIKKLISNLKTQETGRAVGEALISWGKIEFKLRAQKILDGKEGIDGQPSIRMKIWNSQLPKEKKRQVQDLFSERSRLVHEIAWWTDDGLLHFAVKLRERCDKLAL